MKRQFKVHGIIGLLLLMATALIVNVFMAVLLPATAILGIGTVVAGGTVGQADATGGAAYDETKDYLDMKDVQRKVELYKPYQTPLLTLMADQGSGTCESWEKKYFAVDSRGLETTNTTATAISGGTTTISVADSSIFTKNNTVFFPTITDPTKINAGRSLVGIVTGLPASNQINVTLINAGGALTNADLAAVPIYRGGSAHNAKTASTTAWGVLPDYDFNYVQYFMEQIEEEDFQEAMKKQADWNFADMKRMAIDDFKLQRERTFLNGVRSVSNVLVDGQSQRVYTCGGFLQDTGIPVIPNINLSLMDGKAINSYTKQIFTGNNGMKKRFLLGGADFVGALENVYVDNKWVMAKETEVILGIEFVKIVSLFGTLDVAYYEQLDLLGMAKTAIVIDKSNIQTADLANSGAFNIRPIDLRTSGIAKVNAAAIEQYSTMLIKNKATHQILEGV